MFYEANLVETKFSVSVQTSIVDGHQAACRSARKTSVALRIHLPRKRIRKQSDVRTRPRLRRQPQLESLDERTLFSVDVGIATDTAPPVPEYHAFVHMDNSSGHEHHQGHKHSDHDPHCGCSACVAARNGAKVPFPESKPVETFGPIDPSRTATSTNIIVNRTATTSGNGKWAQPNGLGSDVTITYSYAGLLDGDFGNSLSRRELRAAVEEAFGVWAKHAPLHFVEVDDSGPPIWENGEDNTSYLSGDTPDIRIGHHTIDGNFGTLGYAYFPSSNYWGISGDIHLDSEENWLIGGQLGADFLEVMVHEIGHSLGLGHSSEDSAIMNPTHGNHFDGLGTSYLSAHDIQALRMLYGEGMGSVTPIFENNAPEVAPIAAQVLIGASGKQVVTINATDWENHSLTFKATASHVDPAAKVAFALNQEFHFRSATSDSYNFRGHGEKYFRGSTGWFYILPQGGVYQWQGSIGTSRLVGQLDASYHQDLSGLINATEPTALTSDVELTWNGPELTIQATENTPSEFVVAVEVSDSHDSSIQSFPVRLTNSAPTIETVSSTSVSTTTGSLTVPIVTSDPEGDSVALSATASQVDPIALTAYQLQQRHEFKPAPRESYNYRGYGEKYFYGEGNSWFFILPTGAIHRWAGSIQQSPPVGQLDPSFHTDTNQLFLASEPSGQRIEIDMRWSGNDLTIDWPDDYAGRFVVTATASDQRDSQRTSFTVDVKPHSLVIESVDDLMVQSNDVRLAVPITVTGAESSNVQLQATALRSNPAQAAAFDLKSRYGFHPAAKESFNYRGAGEKYFLGEGQRWFFMLPDGSVYRWGHSIDASTKVGELDPSYHSDLDSLFAIDQPSSVANEVRVSWDDNQLILSTNDRFVDDYVVVIEASEPGAIAESSFKVVVQNEAPIIERVANQLIDSTSDHVTTRITASDLDGDSLQYTSSILGGNATQVLAYQLRQEYGFQVGESDFYNYRGREAKYFRSETGRWYFILPDGGVFQWKGSFEGSRQVGQLDASYHQNLELLTNATLPKIETNQLWSGNELTIQRPERFTGTLVVQVNVFDGKDTTQQTFTVVVEPMRSESQASRSSSQTLLSAIDQIMNQMSNL